MKGLTRLDALHVSHGTRDSEITETSVSIREVKSVAVHVFLKFSMSGNGAKRFLHIDHILSDMEEMRSLTYLSAGSLEYSRCL